MHQEIQALHQNNTWTLVPPPAADQNIIGDKWVYKIKCKADGSIELFKARLVPKGYNKEKGVDYFKTFSPVICPTTIRLVISIAITNNWTLKQLDV
jgi:Reverse transcriptase (RNA-dependent DNA polymerase)